MDTWQRYLAHDREKRDIWDREQTIWMAEQEDVGHATTGFTGAAWDAVTGDYAAWLCGHRLGWAKSPSAAEDLIRAQLTREIDHRTVTT
jgi:hypothetical protein